MYKSNQEIPPICFPLLRASKEFENKIKMEVRVSNVIEEEEEDDVNVNDEKWNLILRKRQKVNFTSKPIYSSTNIINDKGNRMSEL